MRKNYFLLLICTFSYFQFCAQSAIETQRLKADSLLDAGSFKNAETIYQQIEEINIDNKNWEALFEIAIKRGVYISKKIDLNQSVEFFQKYIQIGIDNQVAASENFAMLYHKLGVSFYKLDEYPKAIESYLKSEQIRLNYLANKKDLPLWNTYYNIARCHEYSQNFEAAESYLDKSLNIALDHSEERKIGLSYQGLADISWELGDYKKAIQYYHLVLKIMEKLYGNESLEVIQVFANLGISYYRNQEYESALTNHFKALSLYQKEDGRTFQIGQANCLNNLGNVFLRLKSYDKALESYEKSLRLNRIITNRKHFVARNYSNIGFAHLEKKDFKNSLNSYQNALKIGKDLDCEYCVSNWLYYFNIAQIYSEQKDAKTALTYFQKALFTLIPDYKNQNLLVNPVINKHSIIGQKADLFRTLSGKAKSLRDFASSKNNDPSLLKIAFETIHFAAKVIDLMRQDHTAEGSKLLWTQKTQPVYENAIQISKELFDLTKDPKYLNAAFDFSEKSKSIVLLASFKDAEAKNIAGIPDSILQQEKIWQSELVDLEKSLFFEKGKNEAADSVEMARIQKEIFEITLKYDKLIENLETNHPEYHQMKYDMKTVKVSEIQSWLKPNQAMVSYFIGDSIFYAFKVSQNNLELVELDPKFPLDDAVSALRQSMFDYFLSTEKSDKLYNATSKIYTETSHLLFQKIIAPLNNLPEKLILVPAGVLGYIPFEILLMNPVENAVQFSKHPYLIKKHQISYSYSATLLAEMLEKKSPAKHQRLLAFAPSFKGSSTRNMPLRGELNELLHNIEEVKSIHQLIGGEMYTAENATLENFLHQAPDYNILHCATHGKANDEQPHYSYLAFTEKDSQDFKLFVRALYNLKLNADMVTLSACETGIGKLYRGEGIVSLARGFSYAGAKSIITTLWSVNDKKMAELMQSFYTNLKEGKTKDAALHQSKISYLQNNENFYCHPFFWAATIGIGNMSAIEIQSNFNWSYLFIGLLLISIIGFLFLKKFRS